MAHLPGAYKGDVAQERVNAQPRAVCRKARVLMQRRRATGREKVSYPAAKEKPRDWAVPGWGWGAGLMEDLNIGTPRERTARTMAQ